MGDNIKIFPDAPSQIKWAILTFGIVISTLYLDYVTGGYTNPIVFFIATVVFPITLAAISNRVEGTEFVKFLGFEGKPLFIISTILMSAGIIGLIFFFLIRPMAILFQGTAMYSAITFMFLPLSSPSMWFLAFTPLTSLVFYLTVSIGEEILKITTSKNIANWLYEHTGRWREISVIVGFLISLLGWMMCHIFSWGSLPLIGIMMGIFLSLLFISPLFFAEPVISPESGFDMKKLFIIYPAVAGHFAYDFLLSLMQNGQLLITMLEGMMLSSLLLFGGGALLVYQYYKKTIGFDIFKI